MMQRQLIFFTFVSLSVLVLCGCDAFSISARPERLTVSVGQKITTLDPAATVLPVNYVAMDLAYERLVSFEVQDGLPTGAILGDLAESWTESDDGLSWTFNLHKNHFFSDGTEVTAEAVVFTLERIRDVGLGPAQGISWLKKTEAVSPYVVRFQLTQRVPFFAQLLALIPMSIVNPAIVQYADDGDHSMGWLSDHSAGSGPYQVVDFQQRARVLLKENPKANVKPRFFSEVSITVNADSTSRLLQLAKGDIDLTTSLASHQVAWLDQQPGVSTQKGATQSFTMLAMNNERAPLNDIRVRRAIAKAIDSREILKSLFYDDGNMMRGTLPQGVPGYDPTLPEPVFDPDAARRELQQAGLEPGYPLTLTIYGDSATPSPQALAIQQYLQNVGLKINVERIATAARSRILKGDFDLTLQSMFLDFPDPWIVFTFLYYSPFIGVGNMSRYKNPTVDRLLEDASYEGDQQKRMELYRRAHRLVYEDAPVAILYRRDTRLALRDNIVGLNYNFSQPMLINAEDMQRIPSQ